MADGTVERKTRVASEVGLHARPAKLIAKKAAEQPVTVYIGKPDAEPVNAGSLLSLLSVGAEHDEEVIVSAEGEGAEESVDAVVELLETDLDAEE